MSISGAVGAQKSHDLAAGDPKADVVDRDEVAEPLDQISTTICRASRGRRGHDFGPSFEQRHEHVLDAGGRNGNLAEGNVRLLQRLRSSGIRNAASSTTA